MNKEQRQAIINNDFGWLNDIKLHEVDGRIMLGDDNNPFNISTVLRESDFVKNWIMGFALGNDLGINYFNARDWHAMTNRGTRAALIVDANEKPVCLVRPMISHNLTARDFELLRGASQHIQQVQADTTRSTDPNASMGVAQMVAENLEAKRLTITDLVPAEFYEKHGIIPAVEKKIYYIKDIIRRGEAPIEEITRSRDILYRDHRKQVVTAEEYKFLFELSKGDFIIDDKIADAPTTAASEREEPENPLEC